MEVDNSARYASEWEKLARMFSHPQLYVKKGSQYSSKVQHFVFSSPMKNGKYEGFSKLLAIHDLCLIFYEPRGSFYEDDLKSKVFIHVVTIDPDANVIEGTFDKFTILATWNTGAFYKQNRPLIDLAKQQGSMWSYQLPFVALETAEIQYFGTKNATNPLVTSPVEFAETLSDEELEEESL
jgi:hypothetical protein